MSWTGDPDYLQGTEPTSRTARRKHSAARRLVMRELIGAGATPLEQVQGGNWDILDLPLGGRMRVTTASTPRLRARVLLWVRKNAQRHAWGALAYFDRGSGSHLSVSLTLEDFATIVGRLARLERERDRDDAATDDVRGDSRA